MYCTCPQIFYPRNSKDCSKLQVFTSKLENRVDPDELASEKPADQYLHCFLKGIYPDLASYLYNRASSSLAKSNLVIKLSCKYKQFSI